MDNIKGRNRQVHKHNRKSHNSLLAINSMLEKIILLIFFISKGEKDLNIINHLDLTDIYKWQMTKKIYYVTLLTYNCRKCKIIQWQKIVGCLGMGWRGDSIVKGMKDLLGVIKCFYFDCTDGFMDIYICKINHIVHRK